MITELKQAWEKKILFKPKFSTRTTWSRYEVLPDV